MTKPATKAAISTRLYRIKDTVSTPPTTFLVEASTEAQALRKLTTPRFEIDVPTSKEAAALMRDNSAVLMLDEAGA